MMDSKLSLSVRATVPRVEYDATQTVESRGFTIVVTLTTLWRQLVEKPAAFALVVAAFLTEYCVGAPPGHR